MKLITRYQIALFFLLTIALTWAVWIPAVIAKLHGVDSPLAPTSPLGGLARWSPGLVAVLLTAILARRAGVKALFRLGGRVNILWYAFAFFFEVGLFFAAKGIDTLLGHSYTVASPLVQVYGAQAMLMLPAVILFAVPGVLAEELGWRGFALPGLQTRQGALVSSLIIGLVWGIWHIPSLVYFGTSPLDIALAVIGTIPLAILYTWLYNNTQGSLLLVILFHFGQQLSLNLLGSWPGYTDEILMWVIAIVVVVVNGPESLSRRHQKQDLDIRVTV